MSTVTLNFLQTFKIFAHKTTQQEEHLCSGKASERPLMSNFSTSWSVSVTRSVFDFFVCTSDEGCSKAERTNWKKIENFTKNRILAKKVRKQTLYGNKQASFICFRLAWHLENAINWYNEVLSKSNSFKFGICLIRRKNLFVDKYTHPSGSIDYIQSNS